MIKIKIFSKIVLLALTLSLILTSFAACSKDNGEENADDSDKNKETKELLDISEYTIVRAGMVNNRVTTQTVNLKNAIKETIGLDLAVVVDDDNAESEKEILIGKTNRASSQAALDKLAEKTDKEAYIIDITDNKIAIVGTTDNATQRALKLFILNYVNESSEGIRLCIDAGKTVMQRYYTENVTFLSNNAEWETRSPVTIFEAKGLTNALGYLTDATSCHYPSIIELKYQKNEEDNGKLIAHFCLRDSETDTDACFMESSDGGKTWSLLSRPEAQKSKNLAPGQMAHLYELPEQLGEYPAGTLVYSSGSINYSIRSEIWIWYSTDCGKTWTQTAEIAEGGAVNVVPGWHEQSGVWEPFTWYEDGYLYCFYSDDSDKKHDQKLVYKRSKDGVNWSNMVDVCTFDDPGARPGMFVMTKMGNGEFFMVYEYVNDPSVSGAPVYYKTTKDITSWNPSNKGTLVETAEGEYPASAPSCVWVPEGGECGTLIVTATSTATKIFISFDYGETWETIANPMPYSSKGIDNSNGKPGYSASLILGADGRTVYFLNTTNIPGTSRCRIQFTTIKIYD